MILKNKLTKEEIKLTQVEFYTKFFYEIQNAFNEYKKMEIKRRQLKGDLHYECFCNLEDEFKRDIIWNFNHLSNSVWYICQLC